MRDLKVEYLLKLPLPELVSIANKVRKGSVGPVVELCCIVNAKSGLCSEDCKFCAQSSRHLTGISAYPLKETGKLVEAALSARDIGAERFGIVTSGGTIPREELQRIAETVSEIKNKVGIEVCASLGKLERDGLSILKNAGLSRYHHNIETSPNYFPKIVTTHRFQDRIETINAAQSLGLEVCSGGIIGMGESWQDRIDMLLLLKELDVDSIPLNVLVPIKGTPLESVIPISCMDVIKTICIFRIILKDKTIKLAAGRENILKDFQALAFMAGANGMLIGGYLTIKGRDITEDRTFVNEIEKIWAE